MKIYKFTPSQTDWLAELLDEESFNYQKTWLRVGQLDVNRTITKSRQIGATSTFAREGLLDALVTGRNQIYYAPTRKHALCSLQYIRHIAVRLGVAIEDAESNLQLDNGASITFLGEESIFVNYAGNVYFDEFGWFKKPLQAAKIANSIAMHKNHRQTWYTSPSDYAEAFRMWRGDFSRGTAKHPRIHTDGSSFCSDGVWRQSVTLEQAAQQGNTLIDIEQIKHYFTPEEYRRLFGCDWSRAITAM